MGITILGCQALARTGGHFQCVLVTCRDLPCTSIHGIRKNFSLQTSHFASSTYYEDLEISPQSSSKQIKEAYFKLSKQYHPDVTKNNEVLLLKFQSVSEAYSVLSNPKLRRAYDTGKLGQGSSVADGEVSAHQFDKERFYDNRAAARLKTARGQANLDDWINEHRSVTFRRKSVNRLTNPYNIKNTAGTRGIEIHNKQTNNPATDAIIFKWLSSSIVTFSIIYFIFR